MSGLDTTLKVLIRTPNEAATPVLVAALDGDDRDLQEAALRALLERRSGEGHRALMRRWGRFSERWRAILCERSDRLFSALRDTIQDARPEVAVNGCAAAVVMHEYDAMPALIAVAESPPAVSAEAAANALLALADALYDELANPRDYRERRDPHLVQQHVTGALEAAVGRLSQHQRPEILEAFVLLAKSDNGLLRSILEEPRHPAHSCVRSILRESPRMGVINKILRLLERGAVPAAVITVVGQRRDVPFLRRLAKLVGPMPSDTVRRNLRRVISFHWFDDLHVLQALNDSEQATIMEIAALSSVPRPEVFRMLQYLLEHGSTGGRRAAVTALGEFHGVEANEVALRALDDADPVVQSIVTRQLRSRNLPGAMKKLIAMVDHPHEDVRAAVRDSLSEFNFQRYLAAFDILEPDVRRTTGALVRRIDQETVPQLAAELASPSRIRRMRALQVAPLIHVVDEVEGYIMALLADDDHFLRAEAARALGASRSPEAERALRAAIQDRNHLVQEAAQQALVALLHPPAPPTIIDSALLMPSGNDSAATITGSMPTEAV